ncbi:oligosaccharyltransferase complex subunit epsilon [Fusarium chlamydosporum]
MAPKKNAREATPATAATTQASTSTTAPIPLAPEQTKPIVPKKSDARANVQWAQIPQTLYNHYINETPQRIMLLDVFLVYLVVVGALQFLNCVIAGTYVRIQKFMYKLTDTDVLAALQRLPVWFLCDSGT